MPYDHAEIARQIQISLTDAQRAAASRADATEVAVEVYGNTAHDEWVTRVEGTQTRRWVAVPVSPLHEFASATPSADDYTIVASDSSFIQPDKHRGSYCYLINVGRVMLRYGDNYDAELDSGATHYIDPLLEGEEYQMSGRLLQTECALQELKELRTLAAEHTADVALLDGSLLQSWLASSPQPEVQSLFKEYVETLRRFETLGVPVAGYVSRPASQMVLLGERIVACADSLADKSAACERRCHNVACSGLWSIDDSNLFEQLLEYGQRSPVFRTYSSAGASSDSIWQDIGFCYIRTRYEIARLEFPLWVVERDLLDRLHSVILRQCDLGDGYPLSITLAHNYAVLRNEDRQAYFFQLERAGLIDQPSEKALGKKATGGRI